MTDDEEMLICATRYCIGRMTYVVQDCCRWIKERWPTLSDHTKKIIFKDLDQAVQRDKVYCDKNPGETSHCLGSEMDKVRWVELHTWLKETMT